MPLDLRKKSRPPYGLVFLILAQVICAGIFLNDVVTDIAEDGQISPHSGVEFAAVPVLILSVGVEIRLIVTILRRQEALRRSASLAAAAINEVIEAHFTDWALTPAERDVANLMVKGLPIAEIARIRNNAEGTVKAHLNAIYRKAGSQNRGELLAGIIDSMMASDAEG